MPDPARRILVHFVCTGVDQIRGGIETFFREAFDGLRDLPDVRIKLFKADQRPAADEVPVRCLTRNGLAARAMGKVLGRSGYTIEQLTFLPGYARHVRRDRPDVIFSSDVNLMMRLPALRKRLGLGFKIAYSNGAPAPPPFPMVDHVQQVTPLYLQQALDSGEPAAKHSLVPYGIAVPPGDPPDDRAAARAELGLPADRAIVLSVGWISAYHKRMDYLIREIAALPAPRPFLQLVGRIDDKSPPIAALAEQLLGRGNYAIDSVPYARVARYYQAADVFTLASLTEGFGRVYLEALVAGLPCVVHDSPVTRYVLGEQGIFADLAQPGELARALQSPAIGQCDSADRIARRDSVRRRFSWDVLRPQYRAMFQRVAAV